MTQDNGGYDLKPDAQPPASAAPEPPPPGVPAMPKPGEPGWVPPVPIIEKADPESDEPPPDPDVEHHKGMAILAYVCFLIPLLAVPKSKFARFHANQGLLTFIIWCVAILGNLALYFFDFLILPHLTAMGILHAFFSCIIVLIEGGMLAGALAATLYGIIQAANGQKKELPLFGKITLIH